MVNLAIFWKPEVFGQTVLPDKSILTVQKLMENSNATFWVIFKHCEVVKWLSNIVSRPKKLSRALKSGALPWFCNLTGKCAKY